MFGEREISDDTEVVAGPDPVHRLVEARRQSATSSEGPWVPHRTIT